MAARQEKSSEKPLRARGVARREAILRAAGDLFLQQGYERTSLSQILERAGGSKSLFYEQFGNKGELFRVVVLELCTAIFEQMGQSSDQPAPLTPRDTLTQLAQSFIKVLWNKDVLSLSRIVYTEGGRNPEIADVFFTFGYEESYKRLGAYLAEITASSGNKKTELQRFAMVFFSMLLGDAYDRKLAGATRQASPRELNLQIEWAVNWLLSQLVLKSAVG